MKVDPSHVRLDATVNTVLRVGFSEAASPRAHSEPTVCMYVRTFSLLGEKGKGVVFSGPLRALSTKYVQLGEQRERGLCSRLGP